MKSLRKYILKDGSVYWHKLYYDLVPDILCRNSPPGGDYNYAYYLYQPHKYPMALYDHAKWFIQRGMRGYSDRDVWGWYSHHATMMVGVLRYLRKYKHGYPIGLSPRSWDIRLKIMQEGFQAVVDEENDVTSYKRLSKKDYKRLLENRQLKLRLGLQYFADYYQNLWD